MVWSLQSASALTDAQFSQWSNLLEERAGVCLTRQQQVFLQTQVSMRMRELGLSDYDDYYLRVVDPVTGIMEWTVLIDRLVVKETSFFRHEPSVSYVQSILQNFVSHGESGATFDIWSVGCSTGEEPYTLAMVANEAFSQGDKPERFGIIATDISRAALNIAKEGLYPKRKVELLDQEVVAKYFIGQDNGRYKVNELLKSRICFNQANILSVKDFPRIEFDVIYCQNVLIYFKKWLRLEIMNAFVDRLKPGGVLICGLGEVVDWRNPLVDKESRNDVQAYRRNNN